MVWCGLVWCSSPHAIWSGADWSGINYATRSGVDWFCGVLYVYDLVWTGLIWSVMVYGLEQPGLVQSCYDLVQSSLVWDSGILVIYGNGGGVRGKQYTLTLNKVTRSVLYIILYSVRICENICIYIYLYLVYLACYNDL